MEMSFFVIRAGIVNLIFLVIISGAFVLLAQLAKSLLVGFNRYWDEFQPH
jgi:hypothetical protein